MEPEGLLPHSQMPATCLYPEPAQFNPYPTFHFLKTRLNIIIPSKPGSPQSQEQTASKISYNFPNSLTCSFASQNYASGRRKSHIIDRLQLLSRYWSSLKLTQTLCEGNLTAVNMTACQSTSCLSTGSGTVSVLAFHRCGEVSGAGGRANWAWCSGEGWVVVCLFVWSFSVNR
jgi:hypothetical protein